MTLPLGHHSQQKKSSKELISLESGQTSPVWLPTPLLPSHSPTLQKKKSKSPRKIHVVTLLGLKLQASHMWALA